MEYPQHLRSAWADLYAQKCSAIWRCVDARKRLAFACLGPIEVIRRREAELAARVAEKDIILARCLAAREALEAAEAEFYAGAA